MVLDEVAAADAGEWKDESAPTFDDDSSGLREAGTDYDRRAIARPLPLLGPVLGFTDAKLDRTIEGVMKFNAQRLKRPLNYDEATALAEYSSRMLATISYGVPVGTTIGLYRSYQTSSTFRFPLYQPDLTRLDTNRFSIFRGNAARIAWHVSRASSYGLAGTWIGRILMTSYAGTVMAVKEMGDPRLKTITDARMAEAQEMVKQRRQKQGANLPERHGRSLKRGGIEVDDDASPTRQETEDEAYLQGLAGDRMMSDAELQAQQENTSASTASRPFDSEESTSATGGSAWERIRKGAGRAGSRADRGSPTSSFMAEGSPGASTSASQSRTAASGWPFASGPSKTTTTGAWPRARAQGLQQGRESAGANDNGGFGGEKGEDDFSVSNSIEERQIAREGSRD